MSSRPRRPRVAVLPTVVTDWLASLAGLRGASPTTLAAYSLDIGQLLAFTAEHHGVSDPKDLTRPIIERWLVSIAASSSPATVGRKLAATKSLCRWMHESELAPANPAGAIRSPPKKRRVVRVLTEAQADRLLAAPASSTLIDVRDRALLEVLYATGMRASELAGLKLEALDLERGTVRVLGKGDDERTCPLHPKAVAAVATWLLRRAGWLVKQRQLDPGWLWLSMISGRQLDRWGVRHAVSQAAKRAGLGGQVFPHKLRHTMATHTLRGGANLSELRDLLGHASIETTSRYLHNDEEQLRAAYLAAHPRARPDPPREAAATG